MDSCLFLILRVIWFVVIGMPAGLVCIQFGWICMLTIIGIPLGLFVFNLIPMIMTLQLDVEDRYKLALQEDDVFHGKVSQISLLIRLPYFLLVGWWFSLIWVNVAYLFSISVIGIPFGFWMFNRLPFVTFLTRS